MHRLLIATLACVLGFESIADEQIPAPAVPDELTAAVQEAEQVGALIYRHDRAAWIATDEVQKLRLFRRDKRVRGWLTEQRSGSIVITFVGAEGNAAPEALYQVEVANDGKVSGSVKTFDPPNLLSTTEHAQFEARTRALKSNVQPCSKNYNTVVLPGYPNSSNGWTVYLLPGTTKKNVIPVGGAYKVDVSEGGSTVLQTRPFSKSCMELQNDPRSVALMMTHLLDPTPTEVHVFLNLLAGKSFYVKTVENEYLWAVKQGAISLIEKKESKN